MNKSVNINPSSFKISKTKEDKTRIFKRSFMSEIISIKEQFNQLVSIAL
jgi:hypothetical protein